MSKKKPTKTTKKSSRSKRPKKDETVIKHYLLYVGEAYPSFEDFQVWCLTKKIMKLDETMQGDFKGLIYIHSKKYLINKIAAGVRGASNLIILLRALDEQMVREASTSENLLKPVRFVIDIDSNKGEHVRESIKHKHNNS